jgi:hypothetical protein
MPQGFQTRDKGAIVCSFFLPRAPFITVLEFRKDRLREQRRG